MCWCFCFFFFKQKTAYEMRISDWSSDVCSSDLSASILYVDTPISQLRLNPSKRDWVACFGYLTVSSKSNEMYSTISGPMHVFRDRTKGYHLAWESISNFPLFLQYLEFQTHWYPQITSRRTTRGHHHEIYH